LVGLVEELSANERMNRLSLEGAKPRQTCRRGWLVPSRLEEHRQHGREEGRVSTVLPSPPARQVSLFPSSNGARETPHGRWYGEFLFEIVRPNDLRPSPRRNKQMSLRPACKPCRRSRQALRAAGGNKLKAIGTIVCVLPKDSCAASFKQSTRSVAGNRCALEGLLGLLVALGAIAGQVT